MNERCPSPEMASCTDAASPRCESPRNGHADDYFAGMVDRCIAYVDEASKQGRPVIGIMCEYTPREIAMAIDGVPLCLCGGAQSTIASAEEELPANLCPLIKSTYGFHLERANPMLEQADLVVAETTCDGKKKMFELMARDREMHVLELPQKPDDPHAREHWLAEMRKLVGVLERRFGRSIHDGDLRRAIRTMNRERRLRRELAELMTADPPPLTGRDLLDLKSIVSCIPGDDEQYRAAIERRRQAAPRCDLKDRVRVLMTGAPTPHGAEKVVDLVEAHGGVIVCQENCTGIKPIRNDVDEEADDPLVALADYYLHLPCSVMTPNDRRIELLREDARRFKADCIVDLVWQSCLTYDVESAAVHLLAEGLGLPYLKVVTDYAPSDTARIANRLEALFEMAGSNKAS